MTRMEFNGKDRCSPSQKGESGFTMVELVIVMVLVSILATFIFQIITNSLQTMRDMRNRKERGDDAVMLMEKISRETKESMSIWAAGAHPLWGDTQLVFQKNVTSSTDPLTMVRYIWDNAGVDPTYTLRRVSAVSYMSTIPILSTTGSIVAENVSNFTPTLVNGSLGAPYYLLHIALGFTNGSDWETEVYPRNYQLVPPPP